MREAEANAAKAARDVERLRGLLAKDEISQQQFDATVAAADAQRAAADSREVPGRRSRSRHPRRGEPAGAGARRRAAGAAGAAHARRPGREQVAATRARAASAEARVQQAKAALSQAELNLQYTIVKAPVDGIVSRKIGRSRARSSSPGSR